MIDIPISGRRAEPRGHGKTTIGWRHHQVAVRPSSRFTEMGSVRQPTRFQQNLVSLL